MDMDGHEMSQKVYSFCDSRNASFIVLVEGHWIFSLTQGEYVINLICTKRIR